jgi:hypothetical protein
MSLIVNAGSVWPPAALYYLESAQDSAKQPQGQKALETKARKCYPWRSES